MFSDLVPIVVATLLFGYTAAFFWQPARGRRLASIVFWIYTTVCAAGVVALVYCPGTFLSPGFLPLLHIYVAVLLLALPLHRFAEGQIRRVRFPDARSFLCVAYGTAVISLSGHLTYCVGNVSELLSLLSNSSFGDAYSETRLVSSGKSGLSLANILIVLAGAVQDMVPFLLLCMLTMRKHLALRWALAASTVLFVLAGVAQGARNRMVFFGVTAVGLSVLFWSMLAAGTRRRLLWAAVAACGIMTTLMLAITASRFEAPSSNMAPEEALLVYAGQPFLMFAEEIYAVKAVSKGDMCFPLFRAIVGLDYSATLPIRNDCWETVLGVPLGVFYTFLGNWILDFGTLMTAFLVFAIFLTTIALTRHGEGIVSLHQMLLIYVLYLTVAHGVFYYQHMSIGGNLQLTFTVFCYMLFRFTTVEQVEPATK